LDFGYPGGPEIAKAAAAWNGEVQKPPNWKPKVAGLDMSFSGLKTAFINYIHTSRQKENDLNTAALSAALQDAVSDILIEKMRLAFSQTQLNQWVLCGGVAANTHLRASLNTAAQQCGCRLYIPSPALCADNAAMIACAAYHEANAGHFAGFTLNARAVMDIQDGFM
jgi:N6-L-threonylcarbamoyladenine synthase